MVTKSASEASLTDVERRLVDYVTRGELLDLAGGEPLDDAAMRSWDGSRTVQAAVLRDILRGRLAPDPDPHGLRLRGARIAGRLDLENVTSGVGVELVDCLLGEGLVAGDARLSFLRLPGCRLEHPDQPPLDADRLTAAELILDRAVIRAACDPGAVQLTSAHLGQLRCDSTTVSNDAGPALHADGLCADLGVFLRDKFKAVGAGKRGAVRLLHARLGQLECDGATMHSDAGPALHADGLQVEHDVFLRSRFEAVGAGQDGAVRLADAHVSGQLDCTSATMRNESGPALHADGLHVDQGVYLSQNFKAVGASADGAVRLLGAHLGELDCTLGAMHNKSTDLSAVLVANNLRVDQGVSLFMFEAVCDGEDAAVGLSDAHLGALDCTNASLRNDHGPALAADGLQVDKDVHLSGVFEALGAGDGVTLDLSQARIGGVLVFAPKRLEHTAGPQHRLALDGLTYAGVPDSSLDWLDLVREATPRYAAQPYQQLAAAYRAAGHDSKVRKILIAQRHAQISDPQLLPSRGERAWARLTGLTLGYGYQPWRALLALLAVVTIAVVLALTLGAHGGLARINPQPPAATECSAVERVAVGLDLGLPLVRTGIRAHCDTTASATGQVLTVAGWGLQLLAWAFATLFIAGFTGIVRKT
jgi:hypothetical protein